LNQQQANRLVLSTLTRKEAMMYNALSRLVKKQHGIETSTYLKAINQLATAGKIYSLRRANTSGKGAWIAYYIQGYQNKANDVLTYMRSIVR